MSDTLYVPTITQLARFLTVSRQRASDLIRDGVIPDKGPNGYDVFACLGAYHDNLREVAAGRGAGGVLDLAQERARLAKEQADKVALENAVSRNELMPEAEVVSTWQTIITAARAKFLALPTKMAPILAPLTDPVDVQDKLTAAVHDSLSELVDHPEYGGAEDEDTDGDDEEEGDEDVAAAATPHRKPVGRQVSKAKPGRKQRAG